MKHDYVIDIKGLCCSVPVRKLTKEFKNYTSGEVALVVSDMSSMKNDISAYCKITNHELLKQEEEGGTYNFWKKSNRF